VNALANPQVGKYLNENFVSSFQKVATFQIVNGQKQGGNVAAYFCAPDGRVLHAVAGPVDAGTMLREAKWVVQTAERLIAESKGDGGKFKAGLRRAHAEKLQRETGLAVEPATFDPPEVMGENDALTYRDPTGQPLAPKLPPPPLDGPDVRLGEKEFAARQTAANNAPGARGVAAKGGRRVVINNQGIVHQLMAAHALVPIERVYGTVFENILGEKISTKPVETNTPFSWMQKNGKRATE
jgi:hypothetical protein